MDLDSNQYYKASNRSFVITMVGFLIGLPTVAWVIFMWVLPAVLL